MRLFAMLLTLALSSSVLHAAVVEEKLTLPNGLGTAVLYHDSAVTKAAPAVVVVHEWWGLNDYARERAKQLAELGYTAIAVDMYGTGKSTTHPKDATAFMNAALAEPEKMNARFDAALGILRKQSSVDGDKLFAIGYCFGGAVVLNQARRGLDLAGVASFHGSLGTETQVEPGTIKAKLLVATGGADPMVPAKQVAGFVEEMTNAGVDFELLSFPNVVHSFTNPGSTALGKKYDMPLAYDANADKVSWAALMNMLAK
ncbi:dienelactone hydrolase family protein [Zhongshania aquimaris]|uniref:Dienelactone hydrolase family protein n=1 Tax=Zhongshania aquimaris TaxID=2857107 RepID=A0ABS6VRA7_9GAMM|nr:dienelactone hydrolase family protein [Zhongshania aquimaris]MBW2940850.1 dienelactone hydrolase family protein [Zhongshania aquimaris]